MGGQRRYKMEVDGFEVPVGARRHDLDEAVEAIHATNRDGIFSADGAWRGSLDDNLLSPMLEGPHRIRRGERVDGQDTLLAVSAGETFEDIQDRLYRARHCTSPRMLTRHRIAEVLYAGVGAGLLEPVPAARVEDTVDTVMEAMADGRLHPRMLAARGEGLRQWLGLPAGEWTAAADEAVKRGRTMCAAPQVQEREDYDDNKWAL
ncbi:hypothetical protein [Actinopolymorpha pittospori]|uniref:Uncharacterized protein n=1 Tax=Actinopolymorpha pittospori TaxID=648752 RepID=A0A927N404_9ACTN|nr:hypothetical protein [Actinopolymorpha pittospori]MBE1609883.1 hypothetical protein [Actinopolymorpha pittospori]